MADPRVIPAGKFKDRCLSLLDEVAESGDAIVVTKRGRPVAKLVPIEPPPTLIGSVSYGSEADIVDPLPQPWAAET
ncbi:MAG: type II toxin-antitoxin system Phd/YefM family antitoxin [Acidimicrobiia bacterium]|nr:type II toxin-antitoxin system Phd/YefM family antitoxin [Acidimicrobiia bacterium]